MSLQNNFLLRHFNDRAVKILKEKSVLSQISVHNIEQLNEIDISVDAILILQSSQLRHNDTVPLPVPLQNPL